MADGTVRGTFDLDTSRARREVRDYRREAAAADAQTRQLGSTIDRAFGERQVAQIERVGNATTDLARDTYRTRLEVRDQWRGMRRDIEREAAGIVSTIAVVRDRMKALSREKATPSVDVDGIARAIAQVELLHSRLNALGRERVTPRVALGGGGGVSAVRGGVARGGGGGGSGILNFGGVGFAGIRGGTLALAGGIALPAVQSLGGGAVALGGSLGAGAAGAGAAGLGGLAPLVAGIAGVVSVAKPAQAALKEAWQQQDRLTKAVQEYGKNSKQARVESERLDRMTRGRPGLGYATTQARGFGRDWRRLTRPGQRDYYGLLGDVASVGRRAAPVLAPMANRSMGAVRGAGTAYARSLASRESLSNLDFFSRTFAQELPTVERSLEHVTIGVERLARSATPFFREGNAWVEKQTAGWAESHRNIEASTDRMRPLIRSAKDWAHLLGTSWDLLRTLGRAGRPAGDSMVMSLDRTFERWDDWMNANPERTRQFFTDSVRSVNRMATGLSKVVGWLHQLADVLSPILDRFSQLLGLVSSLGLTGAPGSIALAMGAFRGGRQRFGSGSATPMVVPTGGAGAAGAVAAAGAGYGVARGVRTTGRAGLLGPGGVRPLAGQRVYGPGFSYGGPVSQLGRRTTMFGRGLGVAGGAARGALRGYAPIGAALAALDFASFPGSFGQRLQAGASSATLGLIPRPQTGDELKDKGSQAATALLGRLPAGPRASLPALEAMVRNVRREATVKGADGPIEKTAGQGLERGGVTAGLDVLTDELRARRRLVEQMDKERERRRDDVARQRAAQFGAGIPSAFGVFRRAGQSREEAGDSTVGLIQKRMRHMRDAGVETLGEAGLDWARAMAKHHPEMKRDVDKLTDAIEARFKRMGQRIRIVNGDILTGSRTEWGQIRDAMGNATEQAKQKTTADFTAIQNKAIGSLQAMGFSSADARSLVQSMEKGGRAGSIAGSLAGAGLTPAQAKATGDSPVRLGNRKARGGVIGGRGLMDTVQMPGGDTAAPGEAWIANRHTMADLSRATLATYGKTAQQMIRGETRHHWRMPSRHSRGGEANFGGHPSNVNPAVRSIIATMQARFPLSVTSTTDHSILTTSGNPSDHPAGNAVDLAADNSTMFRASEWIKSSGLAHRLKQGIHNPNLAVNAGQILTPPGIYAGHTWAEHANHIHLAALGGAIGKMAGTGGFAGAGAVRRVHLRGVGQRQAGVPGVLRSRAGDMFAAGLEKRLNRALGTMGAGGGGSTYHGPLNRRFPMHLTGTPGIQLTPGQVATIASSVGLPGQTFAQIAHGESNYMPGIQQRDPGDGNVGYGLWQVTPHAWGAGSAAYNYMQQLGGIGAMFNPVKNAEMSKFLFDAAGGTIAPWYGTRYVTGAKRSRGGPSSMAGVAWGGMFDRGGSITTNGPTMFMAGEGSRRRERVTVTPAGQRGHGGDRLNVTIEAGAVQVHIDGGVGSGSDADLDAIAEKVGEKIVGKIIDGIDKAKRGGLD